VSVRKHSEEAGANEAEAQEASTAQEWSPLDRALPASVTVAITVKAEGAAEPREYRMTVPIPTRQGR
jgi:hypothetical protein